MEKKINLKNLSDQELLNLKKETELLISQYKSKQLCLKVQLNSCYGALGNQYSRWYDLDMATSITLSGQLAIKWIMQELNQYLNKINETVGVDYVIAGDTDSVYLNMENFVNKFVPKEKQEDKKYVSDFLYKSGQRINKFIASKYHELAKYLNVYENKMDMDQETISDTGIWVAKKRYILNILVNDGVQLKTPKIKTMGLELKKSSTPETCKKMLKRAVEIIIQNDEKTLQKYIADCRKEFNSNEIQDIAFPRGITDISKWVCNKDRYKTGAPIHVKAAIAYNTMLDNLNLGDKYEKIEPGSKIKFIYLNKPNPVQNNAIAFINTLPKEFQFESYIDYNKQFEKSFLDPLRLILDQIGWETKKTNTLF